MASFAKDKLPKSATRHSAFTDSDDDDDNRRGSSSRHEEVVSFGRDGAQRRRASPKPAAPRVIPVASNPDWRQDRKQRLGMASNLESLGPLVSMRRADSLAVPGSSNTSATNGNINTDAINTEHQKRGLELRKSRPRQDAAAEGASTDAVGTEPSPAAAGPSTASQGAGTDQEALKALLAGEGVGTSNTGEPLIIPQESESEILQHDIDSRPEAPTLDDYAATPIDQFGMALLRGMGWKEGMGAGKGGKGPQQAAEPKKRAALLGLGAKERPAGSTSLLSSSSSRSHKPKDRRDYKYVPVIKGDSQGNSNGRMDLSFALLDGILRAEGIIDLGVEPVRQHPSPAISSSLFAILLNSAIVGGGVPLLIDLFRLDSSSAQLRQSSKWLEA
ncbi:hypothetical protein NDA16_002259 [Ustilago loliicola]|nr:hypothetical protein NDA16_002259 [Ustilago loliicola]